MMSNTSFIANEDFYVTSLKSREYEYTWEINKFSVWHALVEGEQCSPKFPHIEDKKGQWILLFRSKSQDDETNCSVFIRLVSQEKLFAECWVMLMDSRGNTIVNDFFKHKYEANQSWGFSKFIKRETLLEKIQFDDKLYIKCKITANAEVVNEKLKTGERPVHNLSPSTLVSDLKTLVEEGKYGDVTISVGDQQFLAYKGILAARSSVFAAMFEHKMEESVKNTVKISDVEPEVFKELLLFIYSDQLTRLKTMAHKLYVVADKYAIQRLKNLCRYEIIVSLSWRTVAETLMLADMHSDEEMKQKALKFFNGSAATNATETDGWKEMVRTQPHLVDEVVRSLAAIQLNAIPK